MSLREKVVHGFSWNFLGRISTQIFQLGFSVVLARLLTPSEFGVIGMLIVFTGFAQVISDCGLSAALVYNQKLTEAHRSTAFWLQIGMGACLTTAFYFSAPAIARFYNLPILISLTRFVSYVFVVQAIGQTQNALFSKEFHFRKLAAVNLGATVASGALAIALARFGLGIWALAWQIVASACGISILSWLLSDWRPKFTFDRAAAVEMGRYSIYLLGFGSLNYWLRNGDNLAIGKLLGAHALGIYARAYTLMLLPITNITAVLGQVMFPALAQVQNDLPRFGRNYLTATRLIAIVSFPLMIGLGILSGPLVHVLFGTKWVEVIPILGIYSIVGLIQSIISPVGWVYNALGRTKAVFWVAVILGIAFVIAIASGIRYGLLGVAYAYAIWTIAGGVLHLCVIGRFLELSLAAILKSVAKITFMALTMGAVILALDLTVRHQWSYAMRLTCATLLGFLVYLSLCILTRDSTFKQFLDVTGLGRLRRSGVAR